MSNSQRSTSAVPQERPTPNPHRRASCPGRARPLSIAVTATLLTLLGIGRASVAHTNTIKTVIQTLGIATAAAVAGVLIGRLITQ